MTARKPQKRAPRKSNTDPYLKDLLRNIADGKTLRRYPNDGMIFSQGDEADAVFFVESGKVKVTVVSSAGKEAVLAMLGPRSSLGESCLVGQSIRTSTATAIEPTTLFRIERTTMMQALHAQPDLKAKFTETLLYRSIDLQEDICDQVFNHCEKRLARVLLKLARFGQHEMMAEAKTPRVSHETLAEMVGTTRSRVTQFMNKFRRLGLIDYDEEFTVRTELLTDIVLHD